MSSADSGDPQLTLTLDTPPILVDVSSIGSMDRPARAVFAQPSIPSRIALLGTSPVDRVLANAAMGVFKPSFPMKYFTDEAAAVAWLKWAWMAAEADDPPLDLIVEVG